MLSFDFFFQGAYFILARLDLADVRVKKERKDTVVLLVDGVGDQRFRFRGEEELGEFVRAFKSAQKIRMENMTPRDADERFY